MSNLAQSAAPEKSAPQTTEARSSQRLMDYWRSLCGTRAFPSMAYFNIEAVPSVVQHSFLLDFSRGMDEPVFRFAGATLTEECGKDLSEMMLSDVLDIGVLAGVRDNYRLTIAEAKPTEIEGETTNAAGQTGRYRGVLLPLSDDGKNIDCIVGTIHFKAMNEVQAVDSKVLEDSLDRCRAIAEDAKSADSRSRKTLYRALASAYAFYFESESNPDAFEAMLAKHDLKVQERAPFQPVIKLVFGIDYDKTRVSEYAATLAYAKSNNQRAESIGVFIEGHEGGIKGCVAAERASRRVAKGDTSNRLENAKQVLRKIDPLGEIADAGGEGEFVVMIARRGEVSGQLQVLQVIDEKPAAVDSLIKRAARQARKDAKAKRQQKTD